MYIIRSFYVIILFFAVNVMFSQMTNVPDQNFEQALIDLNVDSDGIVNGQVLTSDINNITVLDFSNLYGLFHCEQITDFTGIEDFTALEILNISNLYIYLDESQADVFNSNYNLKEFWANDVSFDTCPFIDILYLDFSQLDHLEYIGLVTTGTMYSINLDNPNSIYENLIIDLSHEYWDPPFTNTVCIKVSNQQAAINNQYPYNTWNIITPIPDSNGYVFKDYEFSSTCTLSVSDSNFLSGITIYPNPFQQYLHLDYPKNVKLGRIEIFDIQGKKIKTFKGSEKVLDLNDLAKGIFLMSLSDSKSNKQFKIVKN